MTAYLLDVNILIGILDREHDFHRRASTWFRETGHQNWLTCPTTENGVVRIMSQSSYPRLTTTPARVLDSLHSLRLKGNHSFVTEIVSLLDDPKVNRSQIFASKQVADTYLLALAVRHGAILATLDRRLSPIAVRDGHEHIFQLP